MTVSPWLKSGKFQWTLSELRKGQVPDESDEFLRKAIGFCRDWLTGKETFEFQTSGSTGPPKKITFRRDQLGASADLTAAALSLKEGDTALICLDTTFIAGAMMLVRCMVSGMNMILVSPTSNPLEEVDERIDFAAFVPLQVATSLEKNKSKLNSIRSVIIGGAAVTDALTEKLQTLHPAFYATYGMTETISHIALQRLNGAGRESFFSALPGVRLSLDERKCLVIEADHLGNDKIVTNDVVEFVGSGKFRWIGRTDRTINSGGVKIMADTVDRAVAKVFSESGIERRFFVAGLSHPTLGEQVTLIIEGLFLRQHEVDRIKTKLAGILHKYEVPGKFLFLSKFAETATQKIDYVTTLKLAREVLG